jgi:sugar transferase EpsL
MNRDSAKRILDLVLAFSALILFSPIMVLAAILIRFNLGSPVLFRQQRPGLNEKPFTIYKFRTMENRVASQNHLLTDVARITELGRFLRKTSLDELPELINVLKGNMSIVGPRPLLMKYLTLYNSEQKRRHKVRPGITGWAQVNGRNTLTWEEKFEKDLWYVDHQSIALDFKIMALTILIIFKGEGINSPGYLTAEEFKGTKKNEN